MTSGVADLDLLNINTLLHAFNFGNYFLLGKYLVFKIATTKSVMKL